MKKIMILGASILQLPAIIQAKEMGLSVVVVDMNPNAAGFKVNGIEHEIISTIDTQGVLMAAKRHHIDGIMTLATDMPMRTVAAVANEMQIVGISEDTAIKATNKVLMRDALDYHQVPIPIYYKVSEKEAFDKAVNDIKNFGFKCIVKPADNSGSRGVNLLKDYEEETLEQAYKYSKEYTRSGELIVEEYMEGPEISVETLSIESECHVIQITDKVTTGPPYFVEMGHSQPSLLPKDVQDRIIEITIAANKAIGIVNGPSHTEIKVTKSGPKVVELGARLGGDNITSHLIPLSTGVNMIECCIKIALGETPDYEAKFQMASAIRYLQPEEGMIKNIVGIKEANKLNGVKQISIMHGIEEKIVQVNNSVDRVGFIIAQAADVKKAVNICEHAAKIVKFETKKE